MSFLKNGDGQPRGPNLLSKAGMAAHQADGNRILSQLEHGASAAATLPAARWRQRHWRRWAAGAACLAALGVGLLAYAPASPPAAAPASAPAVASVAMPAPADAAPRAATIVNDAPAPVAPAAVSAATAAGAPRKGPPPVRQASARPPAARPTAVAAGDSDVTLLTAMVAHAQRPEGAAAPVRDVVLRKEEEETASLLQRCKQLGLIEGMLCRSRICSGRWDSDPACH